MVYPLIGETAWVIVRTPTRPMVVMVKVIGIDFFSGLLRCRWVKGPGMEEKIIRGPGGFFASREDAEKALDRLFPPPFRSLAGDQCKLFE